MRKRVRLHHEPRTILVEPSTAVAIPYFDEVYRAVMFGSPVTVNLAHRYIYEHDAAWPQQRHHAPVRRPNIAIYVMAVAICKNALKVAPFLHHARQKLRAPWIESGIKSHGDP